MARASYPIPRDTERLLEFQERRGLLRLIVCGNVDVGKSTLIGRLVNDSRLLQKEVTADREQGTPVDVAYRVFSANKRNFVVADAPAHEQNTRNMVTWASTADIALILIDALKGVLAETRRDSYLVSLLGIRRVVVAVNKLDLVGYSKEVFERIEGEYRAFADQIRLREVVCIPLSALNGDNVTLPSASTTWYDGPTLTGYLETVEGDDAVRNAPFRMPVQRVIPPSPDFRGFSGRIVGGTVRRGDRLRVLPSGKESTVARIVATVGDLEQAFVGQSITLMLDDDLDISPGDVLAAADSPPGVADQFEATIIWLSEDEMLPGRPYLLEIGAKAVGVTVVTPKYKVNVNTLEHLAAKTLRQNEIGICNLNLDEPIVFDPFAENRGTGGFVLLDRSTNDTIGAGLLHFALRRSQNIHWQALEVNKQAHVALNGHKPCVVWFTGLSGSGKSTIANVVERKLHALGRHTYLLDGDNIRHGLNKDLGFTEADRVENIRRIAEVSRLMVDAGLIVLVSFISPFAAERQFARRLVAEGEFCEVFVDVPLGVAEQRDRKGLYKKARRGELKNFTGIDSPYEKPEHPEVQIDSVARAPEDAADLVIAHLRQTGVLDPA